jgi:hypothetical protein
LLSPEEKKKIIKNLKKYEKAFTNEDMVRKQELDSAVMQERRAMATKFLTFMSNRKSEYEKYKRVRVMLRDGYDSDDDNNFQISRKFEDKVLSSEKEIL